MILKKVKKDDTIKAVYKSSHILASEYNEQTKTLSVIFDRGAKYSYENVDLQDYTRFEIAESQGKVLNSHIKPNRSVSRLDDVDTTKIVSEVNRLFAEELASLGEGITRAMDKAVADYNKNDGVHNITTLNNIQYLISRYIKDANG